MARGMYAAALALALSSALAWAGGPAEEILATAGVQGGLVVHVG